MLRLAICDDSAAFLAQAADLVKQWPNKPINLTWSCFFDGDALIRAHRETPFDIILLDIVMPLLNGIETAKELRTYDPTVKLVFLTTSPEFAVESYSVKASNYLLKPVDTNALYSCLDELCSHLARNTRSILVHGINATYRLELHKIESLEAQNKHVLISLSDGTTVKSNEPLYSLSEKLLRSKDFLQ